MPQSWLRLVLCFLFEPLLVAQSRWIVDPNNGPGTHYTSFPLAVARASAGDVLVLRPGTYPGVGWLDKSLVIESEGARVDIPSLTPNFLQSNSRLTLGNVHVGFCSVRGGALAVADCLIDRLELSGCKAAIARTPLLGLVELSVAHSGLKATAGSIVNVSNSVIRGGVRGHNGFCPGSQTAAVPVVAVDSTLFLHDCDIEGSSSFQIDFNCNSTWAGMSGVQLTASRLSVSANRGSRIKGGDFGPTVPFCPAGLPINADVNSNVTLRGPVQLISWWDTHPFPIGQFQVGFCASLNLRVPADLDPASLPSVALEGAGPGGSLVAGQPIRLSLWNRSQSPRLHGNLLALLALSTNPDYEPLLSAATTGVVWLPLSDFVYPFALDLKDRLLLDFPGSITPSIRGMPFFVQAALFDVQGLEIRMSNLEGRFIP